MGGGRYYYALLPFFWAMFAVNVITKSDQSGVIQKEEHGGWRVVLCIALPRNRGCVGQASHQPVEVQVTLKNCLLSNTAFGGGGHHNRYAKSFATIVSRRSGNKKVTPKGG